eukprot:230147_1
MAHKQKSKKLDFSKFQTFVKRHEKQNEIVSSCAYLERIAIGLKYYQMICYKLNQNISSQDLIVQFTTDTYTITMFLNDFVHLIKTHEKDLIQIVSILKDEYGLKQCDIFTTHTISTNKQLFFPRTAYQQVINRASIAVSQQKSVVPSLIFNNYWKNTPVNIYTTPVIQNANDNIITINNHKKRFLKQKIYINHKKWFPFATLLFNLYKRYHQKKNPSNFIEKLFTHNLIPLIIEYLQFGDKNHKINELLLSHQKFAKKK